MSGNKTRIKTSIKKLPVIEAMLKRRYEKYFYANRRRNLFKGVYASFSEAVADIPQHAQLGYDNPDSSALYQRFLSAIREWDYPVLFWLDRALRKDSHVFDYGGHVGFLYYTFGRYIDFGERIWTVYDVPAVVQQGKTLAEKNQARFLRFTDTSQEGDGCDIMIVSGSQQYIDTPLSQLLRQYRTPPSHLIINMLPLHDRHEFVTLNHIGTAVCPYRIAQKESFINSLTSTGWILKDSWKNESKSCEIPFHDACNGTVYHGFYFVRQT